MALASPVQNNCFERETARRFSEFSFYSKDKMQYGNSPLGLQYFDLTGRSIAVI
jgi:hypothetical protein